MGNTKNFLSITLVRTDSLHKTTFRLIRIDKSSSITVESVYSIVTITFHPFVSDGVKNLIQLVHLRRNFVCGFLLDVKF